MYQKQIVSLAFWACFRGSVCGQTAAKIDFGRDVLPILQQNCFACHGPSQQMNGFRLDRRSSVFKNGIRRVVPGSSENSFLYHRLIGTEYGLQMPPTGPLRPEQIATIKAWIDQGAEWPDAVANEADLRPPNPKAIVMIDALQRADRALFLKSVAEDLKLLNCRGPDGSTPFMYAVLYGDTALLEQLLRKGANPNVRNDTGATALRWAATNLEKTRVLLAHGAAVNVLSDDKRAPLMIAAGRPGGPAIVKLLLDHGASLNPTQNPATESSPLIQAALAGDAELMRMLIDRGADVKSAGTAALVVAVTMNCRKCVDRRAEPKTNEDRIWRLLGLAWAGKDQDATRKAIQNVLLEQRSDGGWPDLPSMESNAYATGRALVALHASGLQVSHPAFQRGVQFLLNTQMPDRSWYVKTRALGFQPYFDSGFPYGVDQFISAAGTSWAIMALTRASQPATDRIEALALIDTR